ncbi:MAG: hypothetical protein U1F30_15720 [Steroidobacteraceae bacterium]
MARRATTASKLKPKCRRTEQGDERGGGQQQQALTTWIQVVATMPPNIT